MWSPRLGQLGGREAARGRFLAVLRAFCIDWVREDSCVAFGLQSILMCVFFLFYVFPEI